MIKFNFFHPLVIVTIPKCSILLTPEGLFLLYSSITLEAWITWSLTIFLVIPKTIFLYLYAFRWQTIIMGIEWSDSLAWIYSFISKPFNSYPSARCTANYKRKIQKIVWNLERKWWHSFIAWHCISGSYHFLWWCAAAEFGCLADWIYIDTVCSHREDKAECVTLNSATTDTVSAKLLPYYICQFID